jgi:hypothetical protein
LIELAHGRLAVVRVMLSEVIADALQIRCGGLRRVLGMFSGLEVKVLCPT